MQAACHVLLLTHLQVCHQANDADIACNCSTMWMCHMVGMLTLMSGHMAAIHKHARLLPSTWTHWLMGPSACGCTPLFSPRRLECLCRRHLCTHTKHQILGKSCSWSCCLAPTPQTMPSAMTLHQISCSHACASTFPYMHNHNLFKIHAHLIILSGNLFLSSLLHLSSWRTCLYPCGWGQLEKCHLLANLSTQMQCPFFQSRPHPSSSSTCWTQ